MIRETIAGNDTKPHVLVFCQHTASTSVRSGVQRVVMELAQELIHQARVDFVKWDDLDGQLRLMDRRDLRSLFGTHVAPNRSCHRTAVRFGDLFDRKSPPWLIFPEIPSHLPDGNEKFARIVSQCREYGIRVAAIFYDLIPVREAAYAAGRSSHLRYMAELVRCDLVIPISRFAAEDLLAYYAQDAMLPQAELAHMAQIVRPVPLGESRRDEPWATATAATSVAAPDTTPRLVMVGTVEPRKQQARLLRVLNKGRSEHPDLRDLQVDIFGSLHPDSSDELWAEAAKNPNIRFHHYAPEHVIEQAYAKASFTAFPSLSEGYGLPIVESVRRGIPCLTANFGAMQEVADGGGCLTIDVLDDDAILRGLVQLAGDAGLRDRLREEIRHRPRRSWVDYSDDVLKLISEFTDGLERDKAQFATTVQAWHCESVPATSATFCGRTWELRTMRAANPSSPKSPSATGAVVRLIDKLTPSTLPLDTLKLIAASDLVILADVTDRTRLVEAANLADIGLPLPESLVATEMTTAQISDHILALASARQHALKSAFVESMFQHASRHAPIAEGSMAELAIVISTYNRGPFVEMNVDWLLRQIDEQALPVRCVVIDNTSNDDTAARLARFANHPSFSYQCNSANTGMLGNLRVCSSKVVARHVWVTGDDDFIAPNAIARTLDAIRRNPGVPLILHNFGVYHRERVSSGDHPEMFLAELQPLASNASPTGAYSVNSIAAEHDNLFTAVYPIVWRSDLLAACFNYQFDGIPFVDLVECVPTTKFILETLAHTQALWFKENGIVGNAHNSWSSHRPRWHLVLMPEVLRLARRSGVDAERLWAWSGVHDSLFKEAVEIAMARNSKAHLVDPDDFESASYFFRKLVSAPPHLTLGLNSERWISHSPTPTATAADGQK